MLSIMDLYAMAYKTPVPAGIELTHRRQKDILGGCHGLLVLGGLWEN